MADDDFNRPLGLGRVPRRPFPARGLVLGTGLALLASGLGYLVLRGDPYGGEPHAVVVIAHPAPPPAAQAAPAPSAAPAGPAIDTQPTGTIATTINTAAAIEQSSGVKIIRGGGALAPGAEIINVPQVLAQRLAPAPDPRLIETSRYGPLPHIGKDGARPAKIYARPVLPTDRPHAPRLALVIGGVGLNDAATAQAIEALPGAVTLAFAPYGGDLKGKVAQARGAGHEVILQLPMEPLDPNVTPGPHALSSSATEAENADNLHWLLARFTGYTGVANFLGGRLTSTSSALQPILHEIGTRGLFYLDDGSSPRSLALGLAKDVGLPAAGVDIILDSSSTAETMDVRWAKLEAIARDKGIAIGMASDLPTSLENVARFAQTAQAHGFVLIPLSAAIATATPMSGALQDP